jgi:hypothetical protein
MRYFLFIVLGLKMGENRLKHFYGSNHTSGSNRFRPCTSYQGYKHSTKGCSYTITGTTCTSTNPRTLCRRGVTVRGVTALYEKIRDFQFT